MSLNDRTTTNTYERVLMEAIAGIANMAARVQRKDRSATTPPRS